MEYTFKITRSEEFPTDHAQDEDKICSIENGTVDFSTLNTSIYSMPHLGEKSLEKLKRDGEVTFSRLEKTVITVKLKRS